MGAGGDDVLVVAEHVSTYHGGAVEVQVLQGKGRVLVAACDFEPGERILLEYPLVEVAVDDSAEAYRLLLKLREEGSLDFSPLFYWAALCTLTGPEVAGARCAEWPTVSSQTQSHALLLHAPPEACLAPSASTSAVLAGLWPSGLGPDPARLERLLQVWIYNSFDQGDKPLEAGVVYLAASMLSHSCAPNAAWHQDGANSFILHARGHIREGEEITIPYLGPSELCLPSSDRRAILSTTKAFHCTCERCAAPLDPARAFTCPGCGGASALAATEPSAEGADALVCSACGRLSADEAAPLLATEAKLRSWAMLQSEPPGGPGAPTDVPFVNASKLLQAAETGGLAGTHWLLDVLRAAAAAEAEPKAASRLLRQRIEVCESLGPHTVTSCARLRLALGEALTTCGDAESLQEAIVAYDEAARTLELLFGDDHPEHREAALLRGAAARRLAREQAAAGLPGSSSREEHRRATLPTPGKQPRGPRASRRAR